MDFFDLMSSEHFHVILHSDKKHGLIFNRLDDTVATINYHDAKELSNLRKISRIYGIVGKYLNRYLVLIKNRSFVGTLYDPNTKKEHDIYVITQVQVIDINSTQLITNQSSNIFINNDSSSATKESSYPMKSTNFVQDNETSSNFEILKDLDVTNSNPTTQSTSVNSDNYDCNDFSSLPITISTSSYNSQSKGMPWNPFKIANTIKTKMPTQLLKSAGIDSNSPIVSYNNNNNSNNSDSNTITSTTSSQQQSSIISGGASSDEADKRLIDEMIKLFNNTNSFYFSPTLDLTNRFSQKGVNKIKLDSNISMWKTADERFFWNKYMLKDLIELSLTDSDANYFINVILQGFIAIENHIVPIIKSINNTTTFNDNINTTYVDENGVIVENGLPATSMNSLKEDNKTFINDINKFSDNETKKLYKLALVSRRSVFQAGTRYRRRGCDDYGNCANFVETEQIFIYKQHFTSLVLLRGSIPLYWYQTGFNYRPPPVLYKNDDENYQAFKKHFENLIETYKTDLIISIDCTEQSGREKALHDSYKFNMDKLRLEKYSNLKLIEFDFHKHCRGRQCSDLQVEKHLKSCGLSEKLLQIVKYYWTDGDLIWEQNGIFRVNCLDCSDRTNVVQRAIALQILDIQLARLGVIAPDTCPEDNNFRKIMSILWSTNGNVLSTQYCGTRALFTGDRKLSGYLKDTYSSASRYYISKFRDAYRQAAIDAMLGVTTTTTTSIPRTTITNDEKQKDNSTNRDHYELINLDPIFSGKSGGALLKDVGNRMSNRLARLKGRFYIKSPLNLESMGMSRVETAVEAINETDLIDDERICKTLDGLNIDWPSSESITAATIPPPAPPSTTTTSRDNINQQTVELSPKSGIGVFSQLSISDDNFQDDDEFSQLMLSIDLAELQKLRDEEDFNDKYKNCEINNKIIREEINMTETSGLGSKVGFPTSSLSAGAVAAKPHLSDTNIKDASSSTSTTST